MSFRIEQKIFIKKSNYINFFNYLTLNNAQKKYPSRKINSLYFDNNDFQMHLDGEEGIVPRKKIRIRNYNNENIFFLEKKISSAEGRFKDSRRITNFKKIINDGILDSDYGLCKPKIYISYFRSYVKLFGFNITIDKDINYQKYYSKKNFVSKKFEEEIIIEIKTNDLSNFRNLDVIFPFQTIRFSKYSKGIAEIYAL